MCSEYIRMVFESVALDYGPETLFLLVYGVPTLFL